MKLELATEEDFDFFYRIKSEDFNMFWTGHGEKPDKYNLYNFFKACIDNQSKPECRKIYILRTDNIPVGYIYIDPDGENFDLPIAILKEFGGKGYGKQAIMLGLQKGKEMGFKRMVGSIREDNEASLRLYKSCGVNVAKEYTLHYIPMLDKNVKMYKVYIDLNEE